MYVHDNRQGRQRHRWRPAITSMLMLALASFSHAADFDEKLKAPMMKDAGELRSQAQAYAARFAAAREASIEQLVRDPALAREKFDVAWKVQRAIDRWEHLLTGLEKDPMTLDREVDWVIKHRLLERYGERRGLAMSDARMSMMDLAYHDVDRNRGLYYLLEQRGLVDRVLTDERIAEAVRRPPQTTRARLRGDFIKAAKAKKRDFTVDWVHLKLNDQAQRTVMCKDPFKSHDERVEKLIESL